MTTTPVNDGEDGLEREFSWNQKVFAMIVATELVVPPLLYGFGLWQRFYASIESMLLITVASAVATELVFTADTLRLTNTRRDLTGTFDESNRAVRDAVHETANQWLRGALLIHLIKMAAMHPLDESFHRQNFLRAVQGVKMCIALLRGKGPKSVGKIALLICYYAKNP